ncbi:CpaF/VirB11 family protein [Vulcanisaeta sp. JCM 16159]|uniref:CpaF/VirB11 family protein n=1 Tax=Vulcanisaeta sp. JCM 16159 TaxID=1295371 RepID=UPI000AED8B18|nr:CpaF/VirB11 family protein [Vulcanisaeta sp. JCM 16159]
MIHGVNAGLQVLGTTHADNVGSLMSRLRTFSLNELIDLDRFVLVIMERDGSMRRVKSIIYPQFFNPEQQKNRCNNQCINEVKPRQQRLY